MAILQKRAEEPDEYLTYVRNQPSFKMCEVLSETSTVSTLASGSGENYTEAFETLTEDTWNKVQKAMIPVTAQRAKTSSSAEAGLGNVAGKVKREVHLGHNRFQ